MRRNCWDLVWPLEGLTTLHVGSSFSVAAGADHLLWEDGDGMLWEDGDYILWES